MLENVAVHTADSETPFRGERSEGFGFEKLIVGALKGEWIRADRRMLIV